MEQKSTFTRSAMMCGLYIGIILIVYQVLLYITNQDMNPSFGWILYVILTVGVFLSQTGYRNSVPGSNIKYSTALAYGILVMTCAGIIQSFYSIVLYKYIDPSLLEKMQTLQKEALIKNGFSDDQIEQTSGMISKLGPSILIFSNLLGFAFYGFIISLITSIFVKKEGKYHEQITEKLDSKEYNKND